MTDPISRLEQSRQDAAVARTLAYGTRASAAGALVAQTVQELYTAFDGVAATSFEAFLHNGGSLEAVLGRERVDGLALGDAAWLFRDGLRGFVRELNQRLSADGMSKYAVYYTADDATRPHIRFS